MIYSNAIVSQRLARRVVVAFVTGLFASAAMVTTGPVTAATGVVTGTVFQDFNSNGVRDTTIAMGQAVDTGVVGIVVRAFDSTGAEVGSTTTSANGTYSLSVTNTASTALRIEFSIPTGVPAFEGLQSSFTTTTGASGSTRGSSIQFASVGDTGVNYAVNRPGDYCQNNPMLVTCANIRGVGTSSNVGAFAFSSQMPDFTNTTNNYNSTTASEYSNSFTATNSLIGSADKLGAIFGIGTDKSRNIFFGTFVKRHVEYGPNGNKNTIYRINSTKPGDVTSFVTLPGTLPLHDATAPTGFPIYAGDTAIYQHVGRVGLGDVDVTPDGKTLLAVDMNENNPRLYFVPIEGTGDLVTAGTHSSIAIPVPQTFNNVTCPGKWHPMGIGVRGSRILVGGVCGAENTVTPQYPNGPDPTQATAFILEYNGTRTGVGSFTTIWAHALGYERGCVYREPPHLPCVESSSTVGSVGTADWSAWNEYPIFGNASNPQPMLSNIEILDTGGLVVGFRDRFFDQQIQGGAFYSKGYEAGSTFPTSPSYPRSFGGMAGGDILRVCATASGLVTESGGTCPTGDYQGTNVLDASGSREYYGDAYFAWGNPPYHSEVMNGSLTSMPGYSGVWSTAYDVVTMGTQGVYALGQPAAALGSNIRPAGASGYGAQIGGYDFGNLNSFNKGNALADLEILCDMAPVQIGDRVWIDTDADGVQDPGEIPVAGVTVRLYDSSGALVSTAVTNTNGEYLFSSTVTESSSGGSTPDALGGNVRVDEGYTIRFDNPADYSTGPLAGYGITQEDAVTTVATDADNAIDSDAVPISGFPRINVPPLSAGANNYSFDAGFVPLVGVGNLVWTDLDNDGVQDANEPLLSGVTVELFDVNGNPAVDAFGNPVPPQTTSSDGIYFFDGLSPGDYQVKFTPPPGYAPAKTGQGTSSTDSDVLPTSGFSSIFTVGSSIQGSTVLDSDSTTLARYVNSTIDAGFVPTVSVGDYVWFDTDNDGVQENGEPGISGVLLTITNADGSAVMDVNGNPVTTTTTDVKGKYSFENLPSGLYTVRATTPAGMTATVSGNGTSASDSSTGFATSVLLQTVGSSDNTLDFGFWAPPAVIGSRVWNDLDGDGRQDDNEPGVSGVMLTVTLADGSPVRNIYGELVQPTYTDAQGNYLFSDLPLGQIYRVEINYPAGVKPTVSVDGISRDRDSSTNFATSVLVTPTRRVDFTLDFGLIFPPCDCPLIAQTISAPPTVIEHTRVVVMDQPAWLNPFISATPSKGSTWKMDSTLLWDSTQKMWTRIIEDSRGVWHVIRGQVRFTPAKGFVGTVSVPYKVVDRTGKTAIAELHVSVLRELPETGNSRSTVGALAVLLLLAGSLFRRRQLNE